MPTEWTYFRRIFYTQYNVPHEDQCSPGDSDAGLIDNSCNFTKIRLRSDFIAAAWLNGTGVSIGNGILKNAVAVNLGSGNGQICQGQYPAGAVGYTPVTILPNGKKERGNGNTFEVVTSITGSCPHQTLVADQSLATPCTQTGKQCPVAALSGVQALSCGDQLNLDSGNYTTASTRSVDDLCPKCSKSNTFNGADGHIDAFSSNTSCYGGTVGNLGLFYTSYPTN